MTWIKRSLKFQSRNEKPYCFADAYRCNLAFSQFILKKHTDKQFTLKILSDMYSWFLKCTFKSSLCTGAEKTQ